MHNDRIMRFVDRQSDLARLDDLVRRRAAGLVALWGRRRVGKTRLLMEWCGRHDGVYTVADQSAEAVQRRYFAEAVSIKLPGFGETEYADWPSLLRRLSRDSRAIGWRGPLILDEFPYLVASSSTLPSSLQNWMDQESREGGLLVAIAGSSQRMMQGLLLDASAPLYGRAIEAFALKPIAAGWIGDALGLNDAVAQVRAHSVWGGIPRYWELAEPFGKDLSLSVDRLILDPAGPLHREPDRLLMEEWPSAAALRPLLDVIGGGAHRLSEIAGRLGHPATSLSRPLGRLIDLGLVYKEIAFGESEKTGRRALYRIADPFFRCWFRVVAPHRALLATASGKARRCLWKNFSQSLLSAAWEDLCRTAIPALCGDESAVWLPGRRWWHGHAPEWDVVSATVAGDAFLAGEVKWPESANAGEKLESIVSNLLSRPLPPGCPPETTRALFVPTRPAGRSRTGKGVRIYDAHDVMKALKI